MNYMIVAAAAGRGTNPGLPCSEATMFCVFLGLAGLMLLTAAAMIVRREAPRDAVRYGRSQRRTDGL